MVSEDVNERVEDKVYKPTGLISILEKIQSKYSYLSNYDILSGRNAQHVFSELEWE